MQTKHLWLFAIFFLIRCSGNPESRFNNYAAANMEDVIHEKFGKSQLELYLLQETATDISNPRIQDHAEVTLKILEKCSGYGWEIYSDLCELKFQLLHEIHSLRIQDLKMLKLMEKEKAQQEHRPLRFNLDSLAIDQSSEVLSNAPTQIIRLKQKWKHFTQLSGQAVLDFNTSLSKRIYQPLTAKPYFSKEEFPITPHFVCFQSNVDSIEKKTLIQLNTCLWIPETHWKQWLETSDWWESYFLILELENRFFESLRILNKAASTPFNSFYPDLHWIYHNVTGNEVAYAGDSIQLFVTFSGYSHSDYFEVVSDQPEVSQHKEGPYIILKYSPKLTKKPGSVYLSGDMILRTTDGKKMHFPWKHHLTVLNRKL